MSLIKATRQTTVILDFSNKVTKNKIKESLRDNIILYTYYNKNKRIIFDNFIKVGDYNIQLVLDDAYDCKPKKLREFSHFQIRLFELGKEINIKTDYRFKKQKWIKDNNEHQLKIRDLVETILYCKRLNNLKIFL